MKNFKKGSTGLIVLVVIVVLIMIVCYVVFNFFGFSQNFGENIGQKTLTQVLDSSHGNILASFSKNIGGYGNDVGKDKVFKLNLEINEGGRTIALKDFSSLVSVGVWGTKNVPKYANLVTQKDNKNALYVIKNNILNPVLINGTALIDPSGWPVTMYGDDLGSWYLLTIDKVFKINGAVATQVTGLPTDSAPIYLSLAYDNKGGWYLNYGDKLKNEAVGYRIDGTNAIYLPKVTAHTGIQYYIDSEGNWYYLDLVATGEYISSITGRISYLYRIDGDRTTQIKKDTITLCSYLYINTCKTKF